MFGASQLLDSGPGPQDKHGAVACEQGLAPASSVSYRGALAEAKAPNYSSGGVNETCSVKEDAVSETGQCDLLRLLQGSQAKAGQSRPTQRNPNLEHEAEAASPSPQCSPTTCRRTISPRLATTLLEIS